MIELEYLSNRISVTLEKIPYVHSISLGIYVKNGSINEPADCEGISHFIEHMLFKGTYNRTPKQIAEEMDELGGQINAYTSKEYTCYHFRTLDKHFDKALNVLSDMFLNSKFDQNDILKERGVITEEINMYYDDPEERVHDMLQENIWKNSPLAHPILGTEKTISNFDNNVIKNYFKTHYTNEKIVISVVGNFETKEMLQKLENVFGSRKIEKIENLNSFCKPVYNRALCFEEKDTEQLHLSLAFPAYKREDEMKYPYTVLNTIFGGGMSSILFQKVREENGLSYTIFSAPSAYENVGSFIIYTALNPFQTESVCRIIKECINEVKNNKISETLLNKTKTQLISSFIIGGESTLNRMTSNGVNTLMLGYAKEPEEIIKDAEKVTAESVKAVAEKIFDFEQISVSACGNIKNLDLKNICDIFEKE